MIWTSNKFRIRSEQLKCNFISSHMISVSWSIDVFWSLTIELVLKESNSSFLSKNDLNYGCHEIKFWSEFTICMNMKLDPDFFTIYLFWLMKSIGNWLSCGMHSISSNVLSDFWDSISMLSIDLGQQVNDMNTLRYETRNWTVAKKIQLILGIFN